MTIFIEFRKNFFLIMCFIVIMTFSIGCKIPTDEIEKNNWKSMVTIKFTPILKIDQLPILVLNDLNKKYTINNNLFISNPNEEFSSSCTGKKPNNRLIIAGISPNKCFILIETGGIGHFYLFKLYEFTSHQNLTACESWSVSPKIKFLASHEISGKDAPWDWTDLDNATDAILQLQSLDTSQRLAIRCP